MNEGILVNGQRVAVPGVRIVTWLDDPREAPRITDGDPRTVPPVAICVHTSRGRLGELQPGARPSVRAERLARYQARTAKKVSWTFTVDTDGDVFQQCDAATWTTWNCGSANDWASCSIEAVQHRDTKDQWEVQIAAEVALIEALCASMFIPRRIIVGPDGKPWLKPVRALLSRGAKDREGRSMDGRGESFAGVVGHCQVVPSHKRGPGDPGPFVFEQLLRAGFEGVVVE